MWHSENCFEAWSAHHLPQTGHGLGMKSCMIGMHGLNNLLNNIRPRNTWDTMIQKFCRYQQLGHWLDATCDANRWSNLMPHFVTFCKQTWRRGSERHCNVHTVALFFVSPVPSTGCLPAYRFHFTSLHFTSLHLQQAPKFPQTGGSYWTAVFPFRNA